MRNTLIGLTAFLLTFFVGLSFHTYFTFREVCHLQNITANTPFELAPETINPDISDADSYKISPCETPSIEQRKYAQKYRTIQGGVLNQWLMCGVLPEYPVNTQGEKPSGLVVLNVLTDDTGKIIKASVQSGDRLFGRAALTAVYQSKTTPRLLGGRFVNVKGLLIYQFDSAKGVSLPKRFQTKISAR